MAVLVLLEQRGGLKSCALEAATVAREIAADAGLELYGVYMGRGLGDRAEQLSGFGLKAVYAFEGNDLEHLSCDSYVPIVEELARELGARIIVGSATALGKELCASVAARLDVDLVQDCVGLEWEKGLKARQFLYADQVLAEVRVTDSPAIVSLRPNVFAINRKGGGAPEVILGEGPPLTLRSVILDVVRAAGGSAELGEARVVVSGGRGIGGPENWPLLQELCDELGAALGASRAAVDAEWISHAHQIGQTGKVVNPDLYIACGISGAIQHLAGMRNSKAVVAINKDRSAAIFDSCDYGIVGDLLEVVPLLTEGLRELRSRPRK